MIAPTSTCPRCGAPLVPSFTSLVCRECRDRESRAQAGLDNTPERFLQRPVLVVYRSVNRDGATYALAPQTKALLLERFSSIRLRSRVFVAHEGTGAVAVDDDYSKMDRYLRSPVVLMLTGLPYRGLKDEGYSVEFRDPVTEQAVKWLKTSLVIAYDAGVPVSAKVLAALAECCNDDPLYRVKLDNEQGDRLSGTVISDVFLGRTMLERQEAIRACLRRHLLRSERHLVPFIGAWTHAEYADITYADRNKS